MLLTVVKYQLSYVHLVVLSRARWAVRMRERLGIREVPNDGRGIHDGRVHTEIGRAASRRGLAPSRPTIRPDQHRAQGPTATDSILQSALDRSRKLRFHSAAVPADVELLPAFTASSGSKQHVGTDRMITGFS